MLLFKKDNDNVCIEESDPDGEGLESIDYETWMGKKGMNGPQ